MVIAVLLVTGQTTVGADDEISDAQPNAAVLESLDLPGFEALDDSEIEDMNMRGAGHMPGGAEGVPIVQTEPNQPPDYTPNRLGIASPMGAGRWRSQSPSGGGAPSQPGGSGSITAGAMATSLKPF